MPSPTEPFEVEKHERLPTRFATGEYIHASENKTTDFIERTTEKKQEERIQRSTSVKNLSLRR